MKAFRKFCFAVVIAGLAFSIAAAGGLFYVYRHPESVRSVFETVLSRVLNAEVSIGSLSFRLQPLGLEAGGISIRGDPASGGLSGELGRFKSDLSLSGPFARRTLTVKTLELSQWRLRMPFGAGIPWVMPRGGASSPLSGLLGSLVDVLLFREVRLDSLRAVDGEIDIFSGDWRLIAGLSETGWTAEQSAYLRGGARFEMSSQGLSVDAPDISISSVGIFRPEEATLGADVIIGSGSLTQTRAQANGISLRASVSWNQENGRLGIDTADLKITGAEMSGEGPSGDSLHDIGLSWSGWYDMRHEAAASAKWRLHIENWLDMGGDVRYDGQENFLQIDTGESRVAAEKIVPLLLRRVGFDSGDAGFSGPLTVGGTLIGRRQDDGWGWGLDARVGLADNRLSLDLPVAKLRSRLDGVLFFSGPARALRIGSRLNLSDGDLTLSGTRLKPFTIELEMEGTYPDFRIETLDTRIPELPKVLTGTGAGLKDLRLRLQKGRVNAAERSFELPEGVLSSSLLGDLSVALTGDADAQKIYLEGREVGVLNFLKASGWWPAAWEIEGRDRLQATATMKGGRCRFDAQLTLNQFGFEEPQGEVLGEKIDLTASAGGEFDLDQRQLELKAAVRTKAGEALFQQFYFDFSQQPLDVSVQAASDPGLNSWQIGDISLEVQGIARLRATGRLRSEAAGQRVDLKLSLPKTAVEPLVRQFILDPFGAGAPFLKTAEIDGAFSADLAIQADRREQQVTGHLLWSQGDLSLQGPGVAVHGATIDFPVWYRSGPSMAGGPTLRGRVAISELEVPVLGKRALDWPLRSGPGQMVIDASTRLDFGGGTLVLGPIDGQHVYQPDRLLKSQISITSVDSDRFLRSIWPDAALGAVNGHLGLTYAEGRLIGSGRVTADLFGGRVTVLNPSLGSLFSPAPAFKCDATLEDIRLEDLTAGTEFGKIEGILKGTVANLEIVDGQPQRFDLVLETERRKGVPQRISVKAVNSISQIGGGQNPFMGLAGSAMKLLPGFGYKKIGIRSTLHNDVFTVNGTIRENGTEYLVRRDGLVGVDVINRAPDNRIRFKDMLKRIQRALAPEGKAVINLDQ